MTAKPVINSRDAPVPLPLREGLGVGARATKPSGRSY